MYRTLERHAALRDWVDGQSDISFVHLIRNNMLKSFISKQKQRHTKVAHTTDVTIRYRPVVVEIDALISYFQTTNSKRRFYREKYSPHHPYLELGYEEMFADISTTRHSILEFFSLEPEPMPLPTMNKTGSNELRNEVTNHQEVIDALTGTEYEGFLAGFVG